jgi:hypothetical protein
MESLPGYDGWLESGYGTGEACQHECPECEGTGKAWIPEEERFSVTDSCEYCFESSGMCDGGCEPDEPDYSWEPEDY